MCWCVYLPPLVVLSLYFLGYRRGELAPFLKPYGLLPLKCLLPDALDPDCPIQTIGPSTSDRVQDICDRSGIGMQCRKNWLQELARVVPEEAGHGVQRAESTAARGSRGGASAGMGGAFEGRVSSRRGFWGAGVVWADGGVSGAGLCRPWSSNHSSPGPQRRLRRGGAAPPSGPLRARTSQFPEPTRARGGCFALLQGWAAGP